MNYCPAELESVVDMGLIGGVGPGTGGNATNTQVELKLVLLIFY